MYMLKSILVPLERVTAHAVLDTTLLLAQRFGSYVEGFAAPEVNSDLIGLEAVAFSPDLRAPELTTVAELCAGFDRVIGAAARADTKITYGWLDNASPSYSFAGNYGRVFDAIVVALPGNGPLRSLVEAALFESGRPLILVPPQPLRTIGVNVMIAWNCSTETARATAFAMPILQQAKHVTVLTVQGGTVPGPSGEQLAKHLRLNGVEAQAMTVSDGGRGTGAAIEVEAHRLGCDLIVKGAYTQSRLRQLVFGGATSYLLSEATLPVWMTH
jgi:nucleotide-binding universal stress UspA family protein